MLLFVIAGHGEGDPGAVGNGYEEAERVRALAARIKYFGGDAVEVGDTSKKWSKRGMVTNKYVPKGAKVIELHMDSSESPSAKGAHVIIKKGLVADKYDEALAEFLSDMFPGRYDKIVGRSNLYNVNSAARNGINYRLVECGFISNAGDVKKFNENLDDTAKGILECFGIEAGGSAAPQESASKPSTVKTTDQIAKEVIDGKWGNGDTRKKRLAAAGYNYSEVQAKVNALLGGGSKKAPAKKSVDTVAREVIKGLWGNGATRKKKLEAAGYNYKEVQARVNKLLK